jgi:Capsule polysaccharide biosynthesis protein
MLAPDNKTANAGKRETIVILSRGARLGPMYREVARDLASDYRVVALMLDKSEHELWRDADDVVCIDLAAEIAGEVKKHKSNLAKRTRYIERETNLPLYRAASNYLLYRRFAKNYLGAWSPFYDTEQHMMEEYVGSYGALSRILDEQQPIFVVYEALDLITTLMAMVLAFRRGIFSCGCIFAPGMKDGTIIFYHGLRRQNFVCSYLMRHPDLIKPENRQRARALIAEGRQHGSPPVTHVERRRSRLERPWHVAADFLRWGGLKSPRVLFGRIANWFWLNRHFSHDMPQSPFILFLMHLQPEASTTSQAPRWVDQERVVEQIAINAPSGIRIVVKENPQCYGWRGKRYFGALADLANVQLCHPLVSTRELIQRAEALVTVTGSGGFEAILHGKRVAVLGRPFYSEFPGARLLDSPEQIFEELADPAWRPEAYETDCETFVAAYLQSVHPLGDVVPGRKWPTPKIIGPNFGAGVRKTLAFIKENGLTPQDFDPGYPIAVPEASVSQVSPHSTSYA